MKITCRNCGKRFDYDTYTGLCPKCSTYYRVDTPSTDLYEDETDTDFANASDSTTFSEYANHDTDNTYQTEYANHDTEDTYQSKTTQKARRTATIHTPVTHSAAQRFRKNRKLTLVLVIAIILGFVVPIFGTQYLIEKKEQAYTLQEIITPTSVSMGQAMSFQTEDSKYNLTITDVSLVTDDCYQVPDGYQLITFHYTLDEPDTSETSILDNRPATPLEYNRLTPYLYTQSGQYLQAVSEYDIATAAGDKDYEWRLENGISSDFEYLEGNIYFLVKERDAANLLIQHTNSETNAIIASYQINNVEVTE